MPTVITLEVSQDQYRILLRMVQPHVQKALRAAATLLRNTGKKKPINDFLHVGRILGEAPAIGVLIGSEKQRQLERAGRELRKAYVQGEVFDARREYQMLFSLLDPLTKII